MEKININDDAIFIADSHTQKSRNALIQKLESMEIPSQIFLLGDISNLLIGNVKSSIKANDALISTLERISNATQVVYFEGNHDFNLESILPKILKIPRLKQPQIATYKDKNVLLAHGDLFLNKKYEYYIKTLTSPKTAQILRFLDFVSAGGIYKFIDAKVQKKEIRLPYDAESLAKKRVFLYQKYIESLKIRVDIVIEGHFHFSKILNENFIYVALDAFCRDGEIFCIKNLGL